VTRGPQNFRSLRTSEPGQIPLKYPLEPQSEVVLEDSVPQYTLREAPASPGRSFPPQPLKPKVIDGPSEGGSHEAGRLRRLSTGGEDVVNRRESFRSKSAKAESSCFSGFFRREKPPVEEVDVVLIGGGIMSATVGLLLKQLEPSWKIVMFERLGAVAEESSNGWNNAGTGHSALCEPNYTPAKGDGVDISKAVTVNENFQLSRQYWAYLAEQGLLSNPESFINVTPHLTFAHGDDQVAWAKKRFEALSKHPLFQGMEFTEDKEKMAAWAPIMMEGRDATEKVAMTRVPYGTDVDFGELTREQVKAFMHLGGDVRLFTTVSGLEKDESGLYDGSWMVTTKSSDLGSGKRQYRSRFVFVGAGGWALPMLQKSGIPEIKGFMGFPISGEFLVCQNPKVAERHRNKVYGKAAIGAPPMSVPHLDSRTIGGKQMVLFGPFAGFSPRYLKSGSLLDLFKSIRPHNLIPAAAAGLKNLDLTVYLAKQLLASKEEKLAELRQFMPEAKAEDWTLITAGQRVQIMKKDPKQIGILQFGTEVVASADGSIAGLLGASPGASTAVQVSLDVIAKCFPDAFGRWGAKLQEMIPSYGTCLSDDPALAAHIHQRTAAALNIL